MRVAALYDIHGNLPALEAVLDDVRRAGVDRIVVGGDVMPGPMTGDTLAFLLTLDIPVQFVRGNGEIAVLAEHRGENPYELPETLRPWLRHAAEQLDDDSRRVVGGWPRTLIVQIDGLGDALFCHATPRDENEIFLRTTSDEVLRPIFDAAGVPLVVCGHTHMQFDRAIGATRVVNAGSVGMPFQEPGAYWLLLGPGVQLRRTDYDLARAADRIRASGFPQAEQFAANNVLQPPSETSMLEMFSKLEIKT